MGAALTEAMADCPVTTPVPASQGGDHVFHQFVVQSDDRDRLRNHLADLGIATTIHYPIPIHRTAAYSPDGAATYLPVVEALAELILSLPMHPGMSDEEINSIADTVRSFRR